MSDSTDTDMTLILAFGAIQRLDEPVAAIDDAQAWSERVGIVSDRSPDGVGDFADRDDVHVDFSAGVGSIAGSLAAVRQRFPTARHVFVGTDDADRDLARSLGWEYLDVDEAAEKADWEIDEE